MELDFAFDVGQMKSYFYRKKVLKYQQIKSICLAFFSPENLDFS